MPYSLYPIELKLFNMTEPTPLSEWSIDDLKHRIKILMEKQIDLELEDTPDLDKISKLSSKIDE